MPDNFASICIGLFLGMGIGRRYELGIAAGWFTRLNMASLSSMDGPHLRFWQVPSWPQAENPNSSIYGPLIGYVLP